VRKSRLPLLLSASTFNPFFLHQDLDYLLTLGLFRVVVSEILRRGVLPIDAKIRSDSLCDEGRSSRAASDAQGARPEALQSGYEMTMYMIKNKALLFLGYILFWQESCT